jgi:hypothetical protein
MSRASVKPEVDRLVTAAMATGVDRATANSRFAAAFNEHTGVTGVGELSLEVHRLYSKMPPQWIAHAFTCVGSNLTQYPELREKCIARLLNRAAPHWIASLAWGLAHRDTVDGLVSAAFMIDHLLGGKNKPAALKLERSKVRQFYAPTPSEDFSIKDVIRRFEAKELPSDELARGAAAAIKELRKESQ